MDEPNQKYMKEDIVEYYQGWYQNGLLSRRTYYIHRKWHDINDPADICFHRNGKIKWKEYCLNHKQITKLNWMNKIKKI